MTPWWTPKTTKGGPCSIFNLTLLNLFIGLCKGARGLPTILRQHGYEALWVEYKFSNSLNQDVVPDLILASEPRAHSLLFEWKSGANLDQDQLDRYSRITAEDLRTRAFLRGRSADHFDITVVAKGEYIDRILIGIRGGPYTFPVLIVMSDRILLKENLFTSQELNQVFGAGLEIDWDTVPMSYIPFDRESPLWMLGEKVIPKILEYMVRREPRISLDDIAREVVPTWKILGQNCQKEMKAKIAEVIRQAEQHEFRDYLRYNRDMRGSLGQTWEITNTPRDLRDDKRYTAWRKLETLQKEFLEALRKGRRLTQQEDLQFPESDNEKAD
jgi:hypothetical protein